MVRNPNDIDLELIIKQEMKKYKVKTQSFNNKRSLALSLSGPPNMLNNKFYGQGAQGEQIKDVPPQN